MIVVPRDETTFTVPEDITPFTKPAKEAGKPKKLYLAVNPFSGNKKGLKVLEAVKPVFEREGVELDIRHTERARHITEMAKDFDFAGYDGFGVIGGDGTLNEFVNGLMNRSDGKKIPIAIIPGGTGNSFVEDLKFTDAVTAAEAICKGRLQDVDVGKVTLADSAEPHWAINIVNYPAENLVTAEKLRFMGPKRYEIGGIWQILRGNMGKEVTLTIDGESMDGYEMMIHVQNNQHTGKKIRAAPLAKLDDGKFDVCLAGKMSKGEFIGLVGGKIQSGAWLSHKAVECRQFTKMEIRTRDSGVRSGCMGPDSKTQRPVNIDGELAGLDPMTLEVVPSAVQVFA